LGIIIIIIIIAKSVVIAGKVSLLEECRAFYGDERTHHTPYSIIVVSLVSSLYVGRRRGNLKF
jgi:hypothetical protein